MEYRNLLFLFGAVFFSVSNLLAQDKPRKTDLSGSKDYPLISRYKGAVIQSYSVDDYEKYVLGTGRIVEKDYRGQGKYFKKFIDLEGKITRIQYIIPQKEGILKVYKNYEIALKKADFEILFTMKDEDWTF